MSGTLLGARKNDKMSMTSAAELQKFESHWKKKSKCGS
jgi:hypothetical protein